MLRQALKSLAGVPLKHTWPRSGSRMPEMMLSSVLLPQPEAPRMAKTECAGTARSTFFSTVSGSPSAVSNHLLMPVSVIAEAAASALTRAGSSTTFILLTPAYSADTRRRAVFQCRRCDVGNSRSSPFGPGFGGCFGYRRLHAMPARDIFVANIEQVEHAPDGVVDDGIDGFDFAV